MSIRMFWWSVSVATLSAFFGVLALLCPPFGLYGVISYGVSRRTREIGIRVALGAQRGSVVWLVFKDVTVMVLAGAVLGLCGALAASRLIASLLYGIPAQDPLSVLAAAVILAVRRHRGDRSAGAPCGPCGTDDGLRYELMKRFICFAFPAGSCHILSMKSKSLMIDSPSGRNYY